MMTFEILCQLDGWLNCYYISLFGIWNTQLSESEYKAYLRVYKLTRASNSFNIMNDACRVNSYSQVVMSVECNVFNLLMMNTITLHEIYIINF